ncbi:hypothetical protein [Natrononativus amylolyticus]|uniref:hypothetical protein n=1 Tax=Natrononativus amylolyticus TaxID=2963434 RepID=UPI0020CCA9B0|nr:hypothetical protein [Natrononativus amylolyticus]
MAPVGGRVVWGTPDAPRFEVVGGFALLVGGTLVAFVATNVLGTDDPVRRFVADVWFPVVLFYAPAPAAAVGAYLRCGAVTGLLVGLVPAGLFATTAVLGTAFALPGVGGGDAPLWSITLAFATISAVAAGAGFLVGLAVRFAVAVVRRRVGESESGE